MMQKTYWLSLGFIIIALIALSTILADNFITINTAPPLATEDEETASHSDSSESPILTSKEPPVSTRRTHTITLKVKKGDNLLHILQRAGITNNDAFTVIKALKQTYNPAKLSINQEIVITSSVEGGHNNKQALHMVQLNISPTEKIVVTHQPDGSFSVEVQNIPLSHYITRSYAEIDSNLFTAAQEAGLSANHIMQLISVYSYDIDFQRDIKKGDTLEILYETLYNEQGEKVQDGKILFANLTVNNKALPIFLYKKPSGAEEYYNQSGHTVQKSLLKTPVNGARLSSGYGLRRHPVLGYSKMHKGLDFAAPIGTPIYAAGNGKIVEIGRKGSYGNYIRIKHNTTYATAYAHLHRFAKGMKKQKYVKQGDIIGYVGKTGRTTGAHLHYEIHKLNKATNPKYVRFQSKKILEKEQLTKFLAHKNTVQALLQDTPSNQPVLLAMEQYQ